MVSRRVRNSRRFAAWMLILFIILLGQLVFISFIMAVKETNAEPTSGIVVARQVNPGYEYTERECTFLRLDCKDVVKYQEAFYQFELWDHERNNYGYVKVPITDFDRYRIGDYYPKEEQ